MKDWRKDKCPICGVSFFYLPEYHPVTCGKWECLKEASERGLLPAKRKEGEKDV
jgi:hypothetical protein